MIFKSMSRMHMSLPSCIYDRLIVLGVKEDEARQAAGIIDWLDDMYGRLDLRISGYHNHVHNLGVAYTGLLLLDPNQAEYRPIDAKIIFLAGLLSDVHLRDPHRNEKGERTAASVDETVRQLRALTGMDLVHGAPQEEKFNDLVTPEKHDFFKKAFNTFFGNIDIQSPFLETESVIFRTDFPSDVGFQSGPYHQVSDAYRAKIKEWSKGNLSWEALNEFMVTHDASCEKIENCSVDVIRRYSEIEKNFLMSLRKLPENRRSRTHFLAEILEVADQSGYYCLGSDDMVVHEVVPELRKEIQAVRVEGTYPYFFVPQLLNNRVLFVLSLLPMNYKKNFLTVLERCAGLSGHETDWLGRKENVISLLKL